MVHPRTSCGEDDAGNRLAALDEAREFFGYAHPPDAYGVRTDDRHSP